VSCVYNDPGKISGDLSHNQHVLLFLCLPVCLSVPNEGEVGVENNSAGISVHAPSHNATALKGDMQRDEVFSAIHLFRFFRIKSRNASIIIVMLVRPWQEFREIW